MEHPILTMRSAAHDIRGYLASASLATERLSEHHDMQVARRAERIAKAIDQVVSICETDLVKKRPTSNLTHHTAADVEGLLDQIMLLIVPHHDDSTDQPKITVSVASDVKLTCDQTSLSRILYNLAVNSAFAIRTHGGTRIDLSVTRDGADIRFVICDDGPGLPSHIIGHLYPRLDRPAPIGKRIGYGLMTTVGLVKEMGGHLQLVSSSNKGTEFCFTLPEMSL
ncbi:MAG: HAMP domain-containing sensor histidine kinase [Pseudomonadota bacterium]